MTHSANDLTFECDLTLVDPLERAVEMGRWADAARLVDRFLAAHLSVHDGYRNLVARLLSWICTEYGEQEVARLNEAHGTWDIFKPVVTLPTKELVRRIADINHWHLSRFRIIEDDVKVTFLLQPCGSGGRLINEGRYYSTGTAPYALIQQSSASTFGISGFPVYCSHCSEMSRTILHGGAYGWIIEGWTPDHRWGGCRLHVYKTYKAVDREFFARLALAPPVTSITASTAERLFSDSELQQLSECAPDRLRARIHDHDSFASAAHLRQARASWVDGLRPAYRLWAATLYREIHRRFGPAAFAKAVRESAWELISKALEVAEAHRSESIWNDYWRETGALRAEGRSTNGRTLVISLPALFVDDLRPLVIQGANELKDSLADFLSRAPDSPQLELRSDALLYFPVRTA